MENLEAGRESPFSRGSLPEFQEASSPTRRNAQKTNLSADKITRFPGDPPVNSLVRHARAFQKAASHFPTVVPLITPWLDDVPIHYFYHNRPGDILTWYKPGYRLSASSIILIAFSRILPKFFTKFTFNRPRNRGSSGWLRSVIRGTLEDGNRDTVRRLDKVIMGETWFLIITIYQMIVIWGTTHSVYRFIFPSDLGKVNSSLETEVSKFFDDAKQVFNNVFPIFHF